MSIDAATLLDPEKMRHGPLVVLWGLDEYVPPSRPMPWGDRPRRKLRHVLLRRRPFRFALRFTPPPGDDLYEFGARVAATFGFMDFPKPEDGDRAVWVPGVVMARHAAGALGSAGRAVQHLGHTNVGSAQIHVEAWAAATRRRSHHADDDGQAGT